MKKLLIYGVEITLNCFRCKKEFEINNPFENFSIANPNPDRTIASETFEMIRRAMIDHQKANECRQEIGK